jgi:hypothetical protein
VRKNIVRRALLLGLCISALAAAAAGAQDRPADRKAAAALATRLPPVDEGAGDPSWVSFRNRLLEALAKRDRRFLLSIVDPNIRNSLEAPRGVATFRKMWNVDGEDSTLWRELPGALFLGSAWHKPEKGPRELCAPYVAIKWPEHLDPFNYGAIVAKEALVKAEPSSDSATLATLSYDLVVVADWELPDKSPQAQQKWVRIRIGDRDGFVPEEQIRSPIEHRACFIRTEAGWRMVAFVVGMEK